MREGVRFSSFHGLLSAVYYCFIILPTPFLTIASTRDLIFGGYPASRYDFFAFSQAQDGFACGSTLVHSDILITAAHCAVFFEEEETTSYIGTTAFDGSDAIDEIKVDEIRIHPDFDENLFMDHVNGGEDVQPTSFLHDIALIKLQSASEATPAEWNRDTEGVQAGDSVIVLGFGAHEDGEFSDYLFETSIKIVDKAVCEVVWSPIGGINDESQICAGKPGAGACVGDSGGPLLYNGILVGIVSFGLVLENKLCDSGRLPNIFTRTSGYVDFIEKGICELSDFPPESCNGNVPTLIPTNNPTPEPTVSPLTNSPTLFPTQTFTSSPSDVFTSSPSDSLNSFEGLSLDGARPNLWNPTSPPTFFVTNAPKSSPNGFSDNALPKQAVESPSSMPSLETVNSDQFTKKPGTESDSTVSLGPKKSVVSVVSLVFAALAYYVQ